MFLQHNWLFFVAHEYLLLSRQIDGMYIPLLYHTVLVKEKINNKKKKLKTFQREGAFKWVAYPMQIAVGIKGLESSYFIYKNKYALIFS